MIDKNQTINDTYFCHNLGENDEGSLSCYAFYNGSSASLRHCPYSISDVRTNNGTLTIPFSKTREEHKDGCNEFSATEELKSSGLVQLTIEASKS